MKKALMVATVCPMIGQFNVDNLKILQDIGYEVWIACDFTDHSVWSEDRIKEFRNLMCRMNIKCVQINFSRNALNVKKHLESYKQLKTLIKRERFELVHCHTPIAAALTRIVTHKYKIRVIYTAHGFHFYKGAPLKNWLIFYPVEKLLSYWTDLLITINREDYKRARKNFHAKKTVYVPGVGIDMDAFSSDLTDYHEKRQTLGVSDDEIMIISVGELSERKNHKVVIDALAEINNKKIKYFIIGKGFLRDFYLDYIKEKKLQNNVFLLGFRTDIKELCQAADLFVFPSHQEGLPVALMEAIASKIPVICSSIRGNTDLISNPELLFNERDVSDVTKCLKNELKYLLADRAKIGSQIAVNYNHLELFDLKSIKNKMLKIYTHV